MSASEQASVGHKGGLARFTDPASPQAMADQPELPTPLQRFLSPRSPKVMGQSCEMCGQQVPEDDHRHVVDLDGRSMVCVCRGCGLLFLERGAAQGRYLTVPERYLQITPFILDDIAWASLQIPVGIVFVVRTADPADVSGNGTPVAFYPSPAGATESELPLRAWAAICDQTPPLQEVEPDVEAVLIRTHDTKDPVCYVVPVDRCYELVGSLRLQWRGFDGGHEAREAMADFFADIQRRSRVVSGGGAPQKLVAPAVHGAAS